MKTTAFTKWTAGAGVAIVASLAHASPALADGASAFPEPLPASTAPAGPVATTDEPTVRAPGEGVYGRRLKGLALSFGGEAGLAYFTEGGPIGTAKGIGRALSPGPHLGLRASIEVLPWLAFDARGVFLNNEGNDTVSSGSLTTVGGFGAVRFTLPIFQRVRPYALLGFGGYNISAEGTSTQLISSTVSAYQAGVGVLLPMSRTIDIGAEYLYTQLNGEVLSTNQNADGGDPNSFSLFAQYRFEL